MSRLNALIAGRPSTGRLARSLLVSTAFATSLGIGGHALAADADVLVLATVDQAPPAASTEGNLGEVVVTARKREENLQTTPVSADIVTYGELQQQNLLNFQDLRGAVPDLQVGGSQGGIGTSLSIRGVGSAGALVQTSSKVGLYVDDMYIARPAGNSLMFYDEGSLQVLYGPQGTLFGRNASGGAVVINTVLPSANGSSYMQAMMGNYNTTNFEGGFNVPLTDTIMTRFSFRTESSAGYITHLLDNGTSNNIDDQSFRGQVRWLATDKLTIDYMYERDQSRNNGQASILAACSNSGAATGGYNTIMSNNNGSGKAINPADPVGPTWCSQYPDLKGKYEVYGGAFFQGPTSTLFSPTLGPGGDWTAAQLTPFYRGSPFASVYDDTSILHATYDLTPDIVIKSTTSYRQQDQRDYTTTYDAPVDPYQQYDDQKTKALSEELNVSGKAIDNRLRYATGLYYYNENTNSLQFDGTDFCDADGWNDVEIDDEKSWALYGQADFDLTSKLQLEAGGRYTSDTKHTLGSITAWDEAGKIAGCTTTQIAWQMGTAKCASNLTATGDATWTVFTPMGSITYKVTPDFNFYATVRSSYDEGGFNAHALKPGVTTGPDTLVPWQPDHFVDYEGGLKTEWFDHTLRIDVDGYYQKYENIISTENLTVNGIKTRVSVNVGDAHYDGFEGTLEWAPTKDIHLGATGYDIMGAYDFIVPAATTATFSLTSPLVGVGLPSYGYSVNGSYTLHPYMASLLTVSLNWKYNASTLGCEVGSTYTCVNPGYGVLGGRLNFQLAPDSPWTISAYGTNLLNEYATTASAAVNSAATGMGISTLTPIQPREFGMIVKRTF